MVTRLVSALPMPGIVKRYSSELAAFALTALALVVALVLVTYHAGDSSLNYISDAPTQNFLGSFGATLADMLRQTLGFMSVLIIFASLGWAWRLFTRDETIRLSWRVVALIAALVSGSTLMALIAATSNSAPLGEMSGSIGILVGLWLMNLITVWGAMMLMGTLFLLTLPFALGLKLQEWMAILAMLQVVATSVMDGIRACVGLMRRPAREEDIEDEEEDEDSLDDEDEGIDEDEEEDEDALMGPRIDSPKKKRVEAKKTKKGADQGALDLAVRKGKYTMPSLSLMQKVIAKGPKQLSEAALEQNARLLESVLKDYGVKGEVTARAPGPGGDAL
jgi:S-DNA-T family DNA segregation ATPase FtsK/SpoIIIE